MTCFVGTMAQEAFILAKASSDASIAQGSLYKLGSLVQPGIQQ